MTLDELYRLLRGSHVQSQGIVDTIQNPLVVLDRDFIVVNVNPFFLRAFRVDREATLGRSLFDLGNRQWDITELRQLLADVVPKSAAIIGYEVNHRFDDIGQRTMRVSARQLVHPDHNSTQMLVVFEDVTDQQKADAAKDILVAETRHRMKNLMAMVRGVANQTKADGLTAEEYRSAFMGRFEAVMGAQEFLTANGHDGDLRQLIDDSAGPFAEERIDLSGEAVAIPEHLVMPLAMTIHELATNALKYGALSNEAGRIALGWTTEHRDGEEHLVLNWKESGGPEVHEPQKHGFGTRLVTYNMKAEGGHAVFSFEPTGLQVELRLPLR